MKTKIKLIFPSFLVLLLLSLIVCSYFSFIFAIIAILMAFVCILYEVLKFIINYKGPLDIKTPDGSNQPYHPSVLFFDDAWNGFRYWLAYTPFPINAKPYRDRWEYPCIAVSNDGINWIDANNNLPLDDLTQEQIKNHDYFSDPHLVYNESLNRIECYYRLSEERYSTEHGKGVWMFRRYTLDGVNWSERECVIHPYNPGPHGDKSPVISPTIIRKDNLYIMWYVIEKDRKTIICSCRSFDGINWTNETRCDLFGYKIKPWHIDCKIINGIYYLLIYDFSQKLTLWKSIDGFLFQFNRLVLETNKQLGMFYNNSLYRACILKDSDSVKIYFSAGNVSKVCIGLMEGRDISTTCVVSGSQKVNFLDFLLDFIRKYTFLERYILFKLFKIGRGF